MFREYRIQSNLKRLESNKPWTQIKGVRRLAKLRYMQVVPSLLKILNATEHKELMRHVIRALGELGDRQAVEHLIDVAMAQRRFKDLTFLNARYDAATTLGKLGGS